MLIKVVSSTVETLADELTFRAFRPAMTVCTVINKSNKDDKNTENNF